MTTTQVLARLGMGAVAAATVVAAAVPAAAGSGRQQAYDGYLEETNAWGIDELEVEPAWQTTRGAGVTIAVVDTGMGEHPYFADKDVLPGYSTMFEHEEDAWYDTAPDDPDDPNDKRGHGTAVAAMALMVAPEATILPVRQSVGDEDGFLNRGGMGEREAEAIRWAVDNGADVIVMAWAVCCGEADEDAYMAMQYAIDHDVVLAAAAGNEADERIAWHFPAASPGVVTVTGLGDDGGPWESSTTGPEAVVAGPADYSLAAPVPQSDPELDDACEWGCPDDGDDAPDLYRLTGGTSSAVGWVGGVLGLIRAAHPDLDADDVIQRLVQTADDRGAPGRDEVFGFGVPDAAAAVTADVEPVDANPLGYPLGVAGASGEGVGGTAASGAGGDDAGAAGGGDGGGSDLVAGGIGMAAGATLAALTWLVVLRRRARPASARPGWPGAAPPAPAGGRGLALAVVVALVAAAGTYGAADAVVGASGADSGAGGTGALDVGAATDDRAGEPGNAAPAGEGSAADGSPAAVAAQEWQAAHTAGDLDAFRSLTCENPWYRVTMNVAWLEDPGYVRPGFAILHEFDGDWYGEDYRVTRSSDGKAWVEAGDLSIGSNPTYEIALVREDGTWKVCDFWHTGPGWQSIPEWQERRPPDDVSSPS